MKLRRKTVASESCRRLAQSTLVKHQASIEPHVIKRWLLVNQRIISSSFVFHNLSLASHCCESRQCTFVDHRGGYRPLYLYKFAFVKGGKADAGGLWGWHHLRRDHRRARKKSRPRSKLVHH
jgi:hypothetical protein